MEVISLKMEPEMLKNIDSALKKHNYGTRTEFIRDSIRVRLSDLNKETALAEFAKLKGSVKTRISEKNYRKNREELGKELAKRFGVSLD